MGLGAIGICRPCVKRHLGRQEIGNDPDQVLLEVCRPFPVIMKAGKPDVLVGLPLDKTKESCPHRTSVEGGVPHGELLLILPCSERFSSKLLAVEEMLGKDPHPPALEAGLEEALIGDT